MGFVLTLEILDSSQTCNHDFAIKLEEYLVSLRTLSLHGIVWEGHTRFKEGITILVN